MIRAYRAWLCYSQGRIPRTVSTGSLLVTSRYIRSVKNFSENVGVALSLPKINFSKLKVFHTILMMSLLWTMTIKFPTDILHGNEISFRSSSLVVL